MTHQLTENENQVGEVQRTISNLQATLQETASYKTSTLSEKEEKLKKKNEAEAFLQSRTQEYNKFKTESTETVTNQISSMQVITTNFQSFDIV